MLKVYVGSCSADFLRTRAAYGVLRALGHEITHDWTVYVEQFGESATQRELWREHAEGDLDGVRAADVVLVLLPDDRTKGCGMWIELGAALALGKKVVLAGSRHDTRTIFVALAARTFLHDAEALEWIAKGCPDG